MKIVINSSNKSFAAVPALIIADAIEPVVVEGIPADFIGDLILQISRCNAVLSENILTRQPDGTATGTINTQTAQIIGQFAGHPHSPESIPVLLTVGQPTRIAGRGGIALMKNPLSHTPSVIVNPEKVIGAHNADPESHPDIREQLGGDAEVAVAEHNGGEATREGRSFSLVGLDLDNPVPIGIMPALGRIDVSGKAAWLDELGAKWFCVRERIPESIRFGADYALLTAEGDNITLFNDSGDGSISANSSSIQRWLAGSYEAASADNTHAALMAAVEKELAAAENVVAALRESLNALSGITPPRSTTLPKMNGAASLGTDYTYAPGGHVHPTDTTRAPLASPKFSGTVMVGAKVAVVRAAGDGNVIGNDVYLDGQNDSPVVLSGYEGNMHNTHYCARIGSYGGIGGGSGFMSYHCFVVGNYSYSSGNENNVFGSNLTVGGEKEYVTLIGAQDSAVITYGTQISSFCPLGPKGARLALWHTSDAKPYFGIQENDPIAGTSIGAKIPLAAFVNMLKSFGGEDWVIADSESSSS